MRSLVVALVCVLVLLSGSMDAQFNRVRIAGRVVDPSGAAVSEVMMELAAGGNTRTALTDADGRYEFSDLMPGEYTVMAARPAYRAVTRVATATAPGSFVLDFVLPIRCLYETAYIDAGLPATLTASDAVLYVRMGNAGRPTTLFENDCDQWYEYRATVLSAIKSPRLTSDTISLLFEESPRPRSGDELIVFVRRHSSGAFIPFSLYRFPVKDRRVGWTRAELPGISDGAPLSEVLTGLRNALSMVR